MSKVGSADQTKQYPRMQGIYMQLEDAVIAIHSSYLISTKPLMKNKRQWGSRILATVGDCPMCMHAGFSASILEAVHRQASGCVQVEGRVGRTLTRVIVVLSS